MIRHPQPNITLSSASWRIINPDGETRPSGLPVMKRILVVDDEVKIVELVSDYLKRAGYAVLVAYDGESALEKVRREKPDLIILDLGLPKMDGLDVTRSIRQTSVAPGPLDGSWRLGS